MKKVIVGISAAAVVVGGFFYFACTGITVTRSGDVVPAGKEVRHYAACANKGALHSVYRRR